MSDEHVDARVSSLDRSREFMRTLYEQHLAEWYENDLKGVNDWQDTPPLRTAMALYLNYAIESLVLSLDEIGLRYLQRADRAITAVFEEGHEPCLGFDREASAQYYDDHELNHHAAVAHKTRYTIDLLLGRNPGLDDIREALERMERLVRNTNDLRGDIATNKDMILVCYLWLSVIAGGSPEALRTGERHVSKPVSPRTRIREFVRDGTHLRMLCAVASFAGGEEAFRAAGRDSLQNLLAIHRDYDHLERTCFANFRYAFDWAWLWENVFEDTPDVKHAIELLRGQETSAESP